MTLRDFQPTCKDLYCSFVTRHEASCHPAENADPLGAAVCNAKRVLFAQFDTFNPDYYLAPGVNRALLLMRLWALCISAATALDEIELEWYTIRIITLMDDLELVTFEEVESELGKYIWTSINSATFRNNTWLKLKNVPAPTEAW